MPLYTIVAVVGSDEWRVTSALPTRPMVGDRIRYADLIELDVTVVVLNIGAGGNVEVRARVADYYARTTADVEERLERLRFRREALTPG